MVIENENIFCDLSKLKYRGKHVIIGKCVRIRYPELVSIDDYSIIDDFTYISVGLMIGKYVHIGPNVTLAGGRDTKLTIGDFSAVTSGTSIYTGSEHYIKMSLSGAPIPEEFRQKALKGNVTLENHVWLGTHSVVLPGTHLPEGFGCAAGTIIRKKTYQPWVLYGGLDCEKWTDRQHEDYDKAVNKLLAFPSIN